LLEFAAVDQSGQRIMAGLIDQTRRGLVDFFLHLLLHGLQMGRHVVDAALQHPQFGLPGLFHPLVEVPLADSAHRVGQRQNRAGNLTPDAPGEKKTDPQAGQQNRQAAQDGITLTPDGGAARDIQPDPPQQPGLGTRIRHAVAARIEIVDHHLGTGDRREIDQPVLVFKLGDTVRWQLPLQWIGPRTQPDLRQPLTVAGKHRHPAHVRLDCRFFEQGLQYLAVARSNAIFGRWRQLARNSQGAGAQRLVEVVNFSLDELEHQQDANDGNRHHGQTDHTSPYS
jgi:hypothetical protein